MMHQSTEQSSTQNTNSSISKLIISPETGNANIALQPGTPFLLQGCMCQEGDGVIVVKVNWRDKTYTGSLMDMEQYPWATPKHVEIAELGSPLDKKHRFSPRLQSNQTKQNAIISQELEEQQPKENDVVMSPQSSDLVESEEGRSPDISKQILPKLNNCTELNKTTLMHSFMDIDRGFRSKQTLGLLSSPSNSLTDLKAEGEKKKNHEMHTGMTHPKEVIQNILGDGNVLPFDTSNRDVKVKFEIDIKEELREDLPSRQMLASSTKRAPEVLLSKQMDQAKKEFAHTRPMMPQIPFSTLSSLPHTLNSTGHLDPKHKLVKPIPEKQLLTLTDQLHHSSGTERMYKSESISPKSSTPDSPNDHKPQKKRKHDINHDNSSPKRPDSLSINNNADHILNYMTPDKLSIRQDDSTNNRSHVPVNRSSSASHQPLPSSPSTHTPKPQLDRKPCIPAEYLIPNEVLYTHKFARDNGKERQDKHNQYVSPQVVPHGFSSNRDKVVRMEKKPKRTREGQSPSDHNMDVSKANHPAFLPAPSDTKIGSLTTPTVKMETQPQPHYIAPELLPYYFPPFYLQGAGLPTIPAFAEQQKLLQANLQDVKVENEKAKQKSSNAHKSKSQPKIQQPHLDFNYFQQHSVPINSQLLAQNPIALMMNQTQNLPLSMFSKDSAVPAGLAIPNYPVMLEPDKDKVRQSLSQPIKHKGTPSSAHSNSNSNRRLIEKNTNHDHQEELTQNSYSQDYIKLTAQQQLLLKHPELNSNNIEQNNNLAQSFKHKSLAATTNNNKLTNSNPALAVLNSNQQAKNGIYPFPFVMAPDVQQMSLFPNIPFPTSIDPSSIHLPLPFYDPVAMRFSQAQVQPDTLDSKW